MQQDLKPQEHIHVLADTVVNQIAAGEVVERAASVVKELVENSLDAGATRIYIRIEQAGKRLIEVDDDGCGMGESDARLCVQRHATSKISQLGDLSTIASFGFRGEALPSIASVSRLLVHTCLAGADQGSEVTCDGIAIQLRPCPPRKGTRVRVRDLFYNTPARQRFMRTDRTEEAAIVETVRELALANPQAGMKLELDDRVRLDAPPAQTREERIKQVLGREFSANSIECALEHEGMRLSGHFGLPTYHHRNGGRMWFFINGRVLRDRSLIAALRAGYRDVLFHGRYPVAVLGIEMDPRLVDVNVHPAKREVRFALPQSVRAGVVACVRAAIARMGQVVSSRPTDMALQSMQPTSSDQRAGGAPNVYPARQPASLASESLVRSLFSAPGATSPQVAEQAGLYETGSVALDLGRPLAQIHRCFILAQTDDGVVIVDQHAAHERITYEGLKQQLFKDAIAAQLLLTPVPYQVTGANAAWLHEYAGALPAFGVEIDAAGEESFVIRSVPAMLAGEPPAALVDELVDACMLIGVEAEGRGRVLERWLGNRACKGSIKAGRTLRPEEQEALLRTMEATPNIAQCNHGRPTYVRLSLHDLERLFGRRE